MTDRESELEALASTLRERDAVEDAWLAKSFTDRLLVVDLRVGATLPEDLRTTLADHDLYGANEVYGLDDGRSSFMGGTDELTRHQFVDVRTRGEHRSYVVD